MPSTCCIRQCGLRKDKNQPTLTMHRLPRNARRRKIWMDTIGLENLNTNTSFINICSRHFEESCFNRTLSITTLREDAVPTRNIPKKTTIRRNKDVSHIETVITEAVKLAQSTLKTSAAAHSPLLKVQSQATAAAPTGSICHDCDDSHPITSTPLVIVDIPPEPAKETIPTVIIKEKPIIDLKKETKLRSRCELLHKQLRACQEKLRRRVKTIEKLDAEKKELANQYLSAVELLKGRDNTDHQFEDILHKAAMKLS